MYIGNQPTTAVLQKQVLTADSVTTTFTLNFTPGISSAILVVKNGVVLEPNTDYTVSGTTLVFSVAPTSGQPLFVIFLGAQVSISRVAGFEPFYKTFTGDGTTTSFNCASGILLLSTTIVFVNGVQKKPITDFVIVGQNVNFIVAPTNGANIDIYIHGIERQDSVSLEPGEVGTIHILDGAVTGGKIATATITADKFAPGAGSGLTFTTLVFDSTTNLIRTSTIDGADNAQLQIASGGAATTSRGAFLSLFGNEHANTGRAQLSSGGATPSDITLTSTIDFRTSGGTSRWTIPSTGHLTQDGTNGGEIVMNRVNGVIRQGTSDGADSKSIIISGGGATISSRGAFVSVYGNEASSFGGLVLLSGGAISTGHISLDLNHASALIRFRNSSAATMWSVNDTGNIIQDATNGSDIVFNKDATGILIGTTDGADNKSLAITAGGAHSLNRGARLNLYGNEVPSVGGTAYLQSGNAAGADVVLGANDDIRFQNTSGSDIWTIDVATGTLTADLTNGGSLLLPKLTSNILVGASSLDADVTGVQGDAGLTVVNDQSARGGISCLSYGANTTGAQFYGFKSRSASGTNANTIVASGDTITRWRGYGADGATFLPVADIRFVVDGTPGTNDMPGRIEFYTTTDGAANVSLALTLGNDKIATFSGNIQPVSSGNLNSGAVALAWNNEYANNIRSGTGSGLTLRATAANITTYTSGLARWEIDTSGQLFQDATNGGAIVCNVSGSGMRMGTSDSADNKYLALSGGGAFNSTSRGAGINLYGNEGSNPGDVEIFSGAVSGSDVSIISYSSNGYVLLGVNGLVRWFVDPVAGAFVQNSTNGGDFVFNVSEGIIRQGTSDASDNKSVVICGGGGSSRSRGAGIYLRGNEHALYPGAIAIQSGSAASSPVSIDALGDISIYHNGSLNWTFNASGQIAQDVTNGGDIVFNKTDSLIRFGTSDGSDSKTMYLCGGGSYGGSRGGTIRLDGNESGNAGSVTIESGVTTGSRIYFKTNNVDIWRMSIGGAFEQNATNGGDIVFNKANSAIRMGTTDGTDNQEITIIGGGAYEAVGQLTRGAKLSLAGLEHASRPGEAYLEANYIKLRAFNSGYVITQTDNLLFRNAAGSTVWSIVGANFIQDGTNGGDIVFNKSVAIRAGTVDGSDNLILSLCGGGASGNAPSRGAYITLYGNETGNGQLYLSSGDHASSQVVIDKRNFYIRSLSGNIEWLFSASGHFTQDGTSGGDIVFNKDGSMIRTGTVDGSDNKKIYLCGGGSNSTTRGAFIELNGNEVNSGNLNLNSSGSVNFNFGGQVLFNSGGDIFLITSSGEMIFSTASGTIKTNSSDGSDNKFITLTGGGGTGQDRGSSVVVRGNESNSGDIELKVGNAGGSVRYVTGQGGGLVLKYATQVLSGMSGATVTATSLIPAKARLIGVIVRVTTTIAGTGTSSFNIGDGTDADRWGAAIALASGTTTTEASFTADPGGWSSSAMNVVLTAVGGNFTSGAVRVTAIYETFDALTS